MCGGSVSWWSTRSNASPRCQALLLCTGRQAALSWSVCPLPRYDDPEVKKFKLNAERNNGRAAMMGITGFAVQEFFWGTPVVQQTPFFFLPFGGFTG